MSWFKTHRQIFENGIWKNPIEFRLFTWLIGNAVYDKDIHYSEVTVKRGQYLRSFRKLQEDLKYIENNKIITPSKGTVERAINSLERKAMITKTATELGTLFTLVNYEKYQSNPMNIEDDKNELGTGLGTHLGQQRDNTKKDKKEKNIYIGIFDHWNNSKVRVHRSLNQDTERKIIAKLKEYKPDEIKTAITNYSFILNNAEYFFTYKWTLKDFLSRGLDNFLDLEIAKNNYRDKNPSKSLNQQPQLKPEYLQ
jgi:hypothetical protein